MKRTFISRSVAIAVVVLSLLAASSFTGLAQQNSNAANKAAC